MLSLFLPVVIVPYHNTHTRNIHTHIHRITSIGNRYMGCRYPLGIEQAHTWRMHIY